MYGYIYETTNLINGKKYIGKHKSDYFDEKYKGSGVLLKNAIVKYDWENFETIIIEECNSKEELNQREFEIIKEFNAIESTDYYNLAEGGSGGFEYINSHRDIIEFHNIGMYGDKNPNYGNPRNYKHSDETRQKMSIGQQKYYSQNKHGTRLGSKNSYKVNLSEDTKKKISNSQINRVWMHKFIDNNTNIVRKRIFENEIKSFESQGFSLGYGKGTRRTHNKGKIRLIKDGVIKYCNPEEFQDFIDKGYVHSTGNFM